MSDQPNGALSGLPRGAGVPLRRPAPGHCRGSSACPPPRGAATIFSEDFASLDESDEVRYEEITSDPPWGQNGLERSADADAEVSHLQDVRERATEARVTPPDGERATRNTGSCKGLFPPLDDQRERLETPIVAFYEDTLMRDGTLLVPTALIALDAFPWLGEEGPVPMEIFAAKRKDPDEGAGDEDGEDDEDDEDDDEDDDFDDFDDDDDLDDEDFDDFDEDEDFDDFDDDDDDLDDLDDDEEDEEDDL
jgi:hypothetical protein